MTHEEYDKTREIRIEWEDTKGERHSVSVVGGVDNARHIQNALAGNVPPRLQYRAVALR
jgi:hypothetical protein